MFQQARAARGVTVRVITSDKPVPWAADTHTTARAVVCVARGGAVLAYVFAFLAVHWALLAKLSVEEFGRKVIGHKNIE
jgi:hypothetical protein